MVDLLEAVDELTLEQHEHVAQKSDDGRWLKAHTVTHASLLQRMADAVTPSSNRDTASASSAATRSPIDTVALFEYAKMTTAIKDWCRIAGVPPQRDPGDGLRKWYTARLADNDRDDTWYTRQLTGWANLIRDHLNPPQSFTVTRRCPICHTTAWGDAISGGDTWPIEVRYRRDDDGQMSDEVARCRVCQGAWIGHEAIIELAEELSEATT